MKTLIVIAILTAGSLGTTAYAVGSQMTPTEAPSAPMGGMVQSAVPGNTIVKNVKHELAVYGISGNDLSVTAQGGTVKLSGTVASNRDVAKAKMAARQVDGVQHVDTSGLHVQLRGGHS